MGNTSGCVECEGEGNSIEYIYKEYASMTPVGTSSNKAMKTCVVHLYDLSENIRSLNGALDVIGFGAFHVGVECFGKEWSYGFDGITSSLPRKHHTFIYRTSYDLGTLPCSEREFEEILEVMREDWVGEEYDLLSRNCVNFCNDLLLNLGLEGLPRTVTNLPETAASVPALEMVADRIL
mmetsp:Transcript_50422/g.117684  ORF Transcript_50422/g.117684 Transcript_50422/m.117684 type:complete len:179 (+) Transcript_50422:82-618(+)